MGRESRNNPTIKQIADHGHFVLDGFGRPIVAGTQIVLTQPQVVSIVVQRVEPLVQMDPSKPAPPAGQMLMVATAQYVFHASSRRPNAEFALVRTKDELLAAGVIRETPDEPAAPQGEDRENGAPAEDLREESNLREMPRRPAAEPLIKLD